MMYRRILVVANMYPSKKFPGYGVFVKNICDRLRSDGVSFDLSVMTMAGSKAGKLMGYLWFYIRTWRP